MNRILVLAVLGLAIQVAPAQLLNESFTDTTFPPPGWATYNKDGGRYQMERKETHYRTAPACAFCLDETDRPCSDWLCTPPLYPTGADTMFRWWFRGQSIGHRESISVWISTTTQELDSFKYFVKGFGVNSNAYLPESVSLGAYVNQRVHVALEYCSDPSQLNIYVDDISGPPLNYRDVGVTGIVIPPDSGIGGQQYYPSIYVHNFADTTQTGFPVHTVIRDSATGAVVYQDSTLAGPVMPDSTIIVDFPTYWLAAGGVYIVESHTALVGDLHPENDTFVKLTRIVPVDVGATMILAPVGQVDSGWVLTPRAVVYNYCSSTVTFPVTFRIGSVYDETVTGITLTPGETDTVSFPDWVAEPVGSYQTLAFTNLAADENRDNDTAYNELEVLYPERHDVGATMILAPVGTIDSGTVVTPRAVVYNYGTRNEVFPVTFRIGSVYDQTVSGITLTPGETDTVSFPDWVAQPVGTHNTVSFTNLTGDGNRANDTVRSSVTIQYPPRYDVGTRSILAPLGTIDSGTVVTPRAVVYNFGTRNATFPVTFKIANLYSQTVSGITLTPGQTDTVSFPNWVAQPIGTHGETSYTNLSNDINRSNDTARATVTIQYPPRHDVGATMIIAPTGVIDSGTVVTPVAVVYNYGTRNETFPVTFRIGSVYNQTVSGITLTPGQTDTVSFPNWVAQPLGRHLALSFTNLTGDERRSNDTAYGRDSITIIRPPRHDVGATAILAPTGTIDSGTVVTPVAVVYNYGTRNETFPVTFRIGSVYNQTVTGITLTPGESDTVSFPDWVAEPVGDYQTLSFTNLTGDENRANDTVFGEDSIHVVYPPRHDVGATMILAPTGTIDSGTVVTPVAVVYNYGTRNETFPVTFRIGSVYDQTVSGVTLAPWQTDTISFPDWIAEPVGDYQTLSFTNLTGDENRANDTVFGEDSIHVVYPERHDVGATMILAPLGVLDSGTVVTPVAVIYNYGTRDETFPVTFSIDEVVTTNFAVRPDVQDVDNVYRETVQRTLTPGQTDTVSFPDWIAQPVGRYTTLSFTDLAADENRANDTVYGAVSDTLEVVYPERHDVGATAILAPLGTLDSGTVVTPRAVVHNFGTRNDVFPATFRIGEVYDQTVTGIFLTPGQTDTVSFPDWIAQPVGTHPVLSFTNLAADESRYNDSVFGADTLGGPDTIHIVYPERHDVGATMILAPVDQVLSGTAVTPVAVVHNYGTRDEVDFPVTFTIGPGYSQTVTASLSPGETDTVSFPVWTASPLGPLATVCFTGLENDENRANDTARAQVTVEPARDVGARHVGPVSSFVLREGILDTTLTPQAWVFNYGPRPEAGVPVTMAFGGDYEESYTITDAIEPGDSVLVIFPSATFRLGRYEPTCWTSLASDNDPANDTATGDCNLTYNPDGPGELKAVVYTRAGERVRAIAKHLTTDEARLLQWDGRNDKGNLCAPGIYICRMEFDPDDGEAQHQFFKLLVTPDFTGMVLTWR